jgi:hypothetical protein
MAHSLAQTENETTSSFYRRVFGGALGPRFRSKFAGSLSGTVAHDTRVGAGYLRGEVVDVAPMRYCVSGSSEMRGMLAGLPRVPQVDVSVLD